MIKTLHAYNNLAKKTTKQVIKMRKVSIFKHLFMMVATFLSYLSFFAAPIFIHANIRMDKQNKEQGTYEITKCFEDSGNAKKYWATLLAIIIKNIIFISGVALIGVISYILFTVSSYLSQLIGSSLIMVLFLLPCVIALLVFMVGVDLSFKPMFYYLNKYEDISIGDAINASVNSMAEQGKRQLFFMNLFYYLGIILYIVLSIIIYLYLYNSGNDIFQILSLFLSVGFIFVFLIIHPRFGIKHRIAKLLLMEDVMIDPSIQNEAGKIKEKMIKQGLSKDEFLVNLFEKKKSDDEENLEASEEMLEDNKEEVKVEENQESEEKSE